MHLTPGPSPHTWRGENYVTIEAFDVAPILAVVLPLSTYVERGRGVRFP